MPLHRVPGSRAGRVAALALLAPLVSAPAAQAIDAPSTKAPATPSDATTRCTAVTRGTFHLRPVPQRKSSGPEHGKGTALRVLAQLPPPEKGDGRPIYRVQVVATSAIGYAYLRSSELGKGCPFLWPGGEELQAGEELPAAKKQADACLQPGPAKKVEGLFTKKCETRRPSPKSDVQIDVNGDGRLDWVVMARVNELLLSELAVLLNLPDGYRTLPLDEGDAKIWDLEGVIKAGAAAYVVHHSAQWESFTEDGESGLDGMAAFTIYRVLSDGKSYKVFRFETSEFEEKCKYVGNADESLTLRCTGGSVRLRWDAAAKVLRATVD